MLRIGRRPRNTDMRGRYEKLGVAAIMPAKPFDVLQDQLIPGRHRMIEHFASIDEQPLATAPVASKAPMRMMRLNPDLNLDMNITRLSERHVGRLAIC